METMLSASATLKDRLRPLRVLGVGALLLAGAPATTWAQAQIRVTGTVTSAGGGPLSGALVRVPETDSTAITNATGRYTISAPPRSSIRVSLIGYRPVETAIEGRTTIDVSMERLALLDQVVVTAYSGEQRRSEITGAVASVNVEAVERQTTASVL